MLIYGSANRDERRFPTQTASILPVMPARNFLGHGQHMCGGMLLARMEMEVMLEALVERCAVIEADEPEMRAIAGFTERPAAV